MPPDNGRCGPCLLDKKCMANNVIYFSFLIPLQNNIIYEFVVGCATGHSYFVAIEKRCKCLVWASIPHDNVLSGYCLLEVLIDTSNGGNFLGCQNVIDHLFRSFNISNKVSLNRIPYGIKKQSPKTPESRFISTLKGIFKTNSFYDLLGPNRDMYNFLVSNEMKEITDVVLLKKDFILQRFKSLANLRRFGERCSDGTTFEDRKFGIGFKDRPKLKKDLKKKISNERSAQKRSPTRKGTDQKGQIKKKKDAKVVLNQKNINVDANIRPDKSERQKTKSKTDLKMNEKQKVKKNVKKPLEEIDLHYADQDLYPGKEKEDERFILVAEIDEKSPTMAIKHAMEETLKKRPSPIEIFVSEVLPCVQDLSSSDIKPTDDQTSELTPERKENGINHVQLPSSTPSKDKHIVEISAAKHAQDKVSEKKSERIDKSVSIVSHPPKESIIQPSVVDPMKTSDILTPFSKDNEDIISAFDVTTNSKSSHQIKPKESFPKSVVENIVKESPRITESKKTDVIFKENSESLRNKSSKNETEKTSKVNVKSDSGLISKEDKSHHPQEDTTTKTTLSESITVPQTSSATVNCTSTSETERIISPQLITSMEELEMRDQAWTPIPMSESEQLHRHHNNKSNDFSNPDFQLLRTEWENRLCETIQRCLSVFANTLNLQNSLLQ